MWDNADREGIAVDDDDDDDDDGILIAAARPRAGAPARAGDGLHLTMQRASARST